MKNTLLSLGLISLMACAHGKLGSVEVPIDMNAVTKETPIFVMPVDTSKMIFTGDAANDASKTTMEREAIKAAYNMKIVDQLKKQGYNAQLSSNTKQTGMVLTGYVTKFEHGSGAARMLVGMGAGSSNLRSMFMLEDRNAKKTVAKFEVIATSGGTSSVSSYMEAHLNDGAEKVAQYIAEGK